jgi:hypothetical protein
VTSQTRIDFDALMRELMLIGVGALFGWTLAGTVGMISGSYGIEPRATLRFLLAVLVLVFARRTYWEIREWRWRKLPQDARYGFSSPLWETPRATWEHVADDAEPPRPDPGPGT